MGKFCKDCKWHDNGQGYYDKCKHPSLTEPVHGRINAQDCEEERKDKRGMYGHSFSCGTAGSNFEATP